MGLKTIITILVLAGLVFGIGAIGNAISQHNADQAAQEQMDLIKTQQVMEKLPDWAQTLIITVGLLVGLETFGPKLLLTVGVILLGVLVIIIIGFGQFVTLVSRPTVKEAYKYSFMTSCLIAGIAVVGGGYLLTNVPGGAELFRKLVGISLVFGYFAMGGGFGFRFTGGSFKSVTDEHGNSTSEGAGPTGAIVLSGRGRTSSDSDTEFK